jgi:hypothetical protein
MDSETRNCQNCKKDFIIDSEDFNFYEKIGVNPPTWCSRCKFLRKLAYLNERCLYKGTCSNCKENIISRYRADSGIQAWCMKCHVSDTWDGRDYGVNYDFSENFFKQFDKLKGIVPQRALDKNERNGPGCEYSNYCFTSKNIYLSYCVHKSDNLKYCKNTYLDTRNCLDSLVVKKNDRCYEAVQSSESFNSTFIIESEQCIESHFLFDCINCINCCMSSNLRNKSNVFRNKQLTKEEYKKELESLKLETYSGQVNTKKEFKEMTMNAIHRYSHIKNSVNCTGDFIANSKNCSNCYGIETAENIKNCYFSMAPNVHDSQDLIMTGRGEECYEITNAGRGMSRVVLSFSCGSGCRNVFYSDGCRGCSDCFGCISLINKKYCILNKQYEKEEYFLMVEKIKKHMEDMPYIDKIGRRYGFGECFPIELSPFAYNESLVYEEEPLSKEEALVQGYKWLDKEGKSYEATIKSKDIADSILDINDDICNGILECPNKGKIETQCTSAFKILPDELSFYRQMKLPIPRYCPNCRYYQRLEWKNPFKFYERECMCEIPNHNHEGKCKNKFETMYATNRLEKIYCKECYQQEVY